MYVYTPSEELLRFRGSSIPASSLRVDTHYIKTELSEPQKKRLLDQIYPKRFTQMIKPVEIDLITRKLEHTILYKQDIISPLVTEAGVRFAVVDPIVEVVTTQGNLKACLEETVAEETYDDDDDVDVEVEEEDSESDEETSDYIESPTRPLRQISTDLEGTPATRVKSALSSRIRCDYTVFSLKDETKTVLLLIEAKQSKFSKHAVAQVMGYFTRLEFENMCPPTALIVTKETMEFIVFPYVADGSYLINGVSLGVEYLWHSVNYYGEELKVLNRSLIKKLLYLSNSDVQEGIKPSPLPSGLTPVKKKDMPIVINKKDTELVQIEELQETVMRLKRARSKIRKRMKNYEEQLKRQEKIRAGKKRKTH